MGVIMAGSSPCQPVRKTDLYLTCIAVNLAATGGTVFAMFLLTGEKSTTSAAIRAYTLPSITIPLIDKIPLIGPMVSGHNILTYFASSACSWYGSSCTEPEWGPENESGG